MGFEALSCHGTGVSCTDHDDGVLGIDDWPKHLVFKGREVQSTCMGSRVALTHHAHDGNARKEWPIKKAVAPLDANNRRSIPSIEGVFVVEVLRPCEGGLSIRRPLGKRLAPSHPHVVVKFAMMPKRGLTKIPQPVGSFAVVKLFPSELNWTRIVLSAFP